MATAKIAVYSRNATSLSERPLFYVSRREAEELLGEKCANVSPKRKTLTHIQFRQTNRDERPSPASITFGEMNALVGACESRTYTERVREKIEAWPTCVDTLAPCVRPRI